MTLLGFARVMRVALPTEHTTDEMSTIFKKSREGLYFTPDAQASLSHTWEELRHQSVTAEGPEIQRISYHFEQILGIAFDGSTMTKETCGLAVVDDQLSLVTDVILDKGIEVVPEIAGAIQRKETYVRNWVVAYDMHRTKFNNQRPMRASSWPEKVWKSDNDSVVLVQAHIHKKRSRGHRESSTVSGAMFALW